MSGLNPAFLGMKKKRGGQMKYNEKTIMVSFRCPESKVPEIKQFLKEKLKNYEKKTDLLS